MPFSPERTHSPHWLQMLAFYLLGSGSICLTMVAANFLTYAIIAGETSPLPIVVFTSAPSCFHCSERNAWERSLCFVKQLTSGQRLGKRLFGVPRIGMSLLVGFLGIGEMVGAMPPPCLHSPASKRGMPPSGSQGSSILHSFLFRETFCSCAPESGGEPLPGMSCLGHSTLSHTSLPLSSEAVPVAGTVPAAHGEEFLHLLHAEQGNSQNLIKWNKYQNKTYAKNAKREITQSWARTEGGLRSGLTWLVCVLDSSTVLKQRVTRQSGSSRTQPLQGY